MTRHAWLALLFTGVLFTAPRPSAAQTIAIELMGGSGYNVPTPLTVHQSGYPDIRMTAHYATKPFGPYAPYYSWRVEFEDRRGSWELQHVHHRLFLTNTTPEITSFSIHYGYNYFLFGRSWRRHAFTIHLSGGVVVTAPASTIRGKSLNLKDPGVLDTGYRLSGGGAEIAATREFVLSKHVFVFVDGAMLAARTSVPVADGSARVPNLSLHGHAGIGFRVPSPF